MYTRDLLQDTALLVSAAILSIIAICIAVWPTTIEISSMLGYSLPPSLLAAIVVGIFRYYRWLIGLMWGQAVANSS